MTPTQRTLAAMRENGRVCGIVEKFNRFVGAHGIRQDLFGFLDILAIDPVDGIIGIQSCGSSFSEHVRKIEGELPPEAVEFLKHAQAELWGWRKIKLKRGGKAERWTPRIADIVLEEGKIKVMERK